MTAKEKAKEFFNKMYNCELDISYYAANQCALIAVDELIAHSKNTAMVYDLSFDESSNYWQEVKQEIEKL
jgi:hypothetical protein